MKHDFRKIVTNGAAAILLCSSLVSTHLLAADVNIVTAKDFVHRLGEACGGGGAEWARTGGPSSVLVRNLGDRSYARIYDTGNYEFSTTCCSISNSSNNTVNVTQARSSGSRIDSLMASPDRVGFGRNTTGGASAGSYTVVTSLNDSGPGTLREALRERNPPLWITFADSIQGGTIYLKEPINVWTRNLTIDGAGSGIKISVERNTDIAMLQFRGGNVIIHGITIDGNNSRSTGLMIREGNRYWIDHVTVRNFIYDDGITVGFGNREDTSASEVTISNYHAYDTNYAMMAGGNDKVEFYPPHRVTIHSSILSAEDRNPRIKNYGTAHLFNNYIHSNRFSGVNAGANSVIYSQNNVFSSLSANNPAMSLSGTTNNGGRVGRVFSSGDVFLDRAGHTGDVRFVSNSAINLPYSYNLKSSSQVIDYVNANAGANNATASRVLTTEQQTRTVVPTSGSCVVQTQTVDYLRR